MLGEKKSNLLNFDEYIIPGFSTLFADLQVAFLRCKLVTNPPGALSSLNFGVRPKLYDAPRRRNHDAERRATKSANPRF